MKKWFVWPVLLAGVLCACGAQPTGQSAVTLPMNTERPVVADLPADEAGPTPEPTPAAETTLTAADLTLEEKVGQLFIIRPDSLDLTLPQEQIDDAKADGVTELTDAMRDALQKYPVGGVCQFGKNIVDPEQITAFNAALQEASDIPLFISVDEEGGAVARLANKDTFDLPRYESAAAVGAEGADAACAMGQTIGGYLRTYGFNMDFAPDADVNTNPDNPIIGTRAFSSDAADAADCAAAMARGLAGEGILPTFKHFPGHGDTAEDSHTGLAYSYRTVEELTACELLPFEAAAEVGPPRRDGGAHRGAGADRRPARNALCRRHCAGAGCGEHAYRYRLAGHGGHHRQLHPRRSRCAGFAGRVRRAADARRPGRCLRCCAGGRAEWHPQRGPAGPER